MTNCMEVWSKLMRIPEKSIGSTSANSQTANTSDGTDRDHPNSIGVENSRDNWPSLGTSKRLVLISLVHLSECWLSLVGVATQSVAISSPRWAVEERASGAQSSGQATDP